MALAAIGDLAVTEEARARRLTFVSLAGISGFLLGPMLGVFIARAAADVFSIADPMGLLAFPLGATAVLAFAVAGAAIFALPRTRQKERLARSDPTASPTNRWLIPNLLILAFIVAAGVGVFEVGLALRGKQELGMTPTQIALMFTECSLVMLVVQAIVFSPWVKPSATRWLIAPALVVLATGLFLLPRANDFSLMLAVIGAVAASAGILAPILTYWTSSRAGVAQGGPTRQADGCRQPGRGGRFGRGRLVIRCRRVARCFVPHHDRSDRDRRRAQPRLASDAGPAPPHLKVLAHFAWRTEPRTPTFVQTTAKHGRSRRGPDVTFGWQVA